MHPSKGIKFNRLPHDKERNITYEYKNLYRMLVLRSREITHADKNILIDVSDKCMHGRDHSWMKSETIADHVGCEIKYAMRRVGALAKLGFLTKYDRAGPNGTNVLVPAWKMVDEYLASKDEDESEGVEFTPMGVNLTPIECEINTGGVRNSHQLGAKFPPKTGYIDRQIQTEKKRDRNLAATASGFSGGLVQSGRSDQSSKPVNDNYPANGFHQFYELYPNKVAKRSAEAAFKEASHRVTFEAMMTGLRKYINKSDDRPWCNPSTWLTQDRWEDEPAQKPNAGMDNDSIDRRIRAQRKAAI